VKLKLIFGVVERATERSAAKLLPKTAAASAIAAKCPTRRNPISLLLRRVLP
jgi:hypothetical protein